MPESAESTSASVLVGTAGWTLPADVQAAFPPEGTHLQRYAGRFPAVEINTTFYRPHRPSTYARWMESVPADFRFCVKVPKTITHEAKLRDADDALATFLAEAGALGPKLACLLVQLPPSLAFDRDVAERFFTALRSATPLTAVCEPRHPTWFTDKADALLEGFHVARVAADPARVPAAGEPGGWRGLVYHRLHGSPKIYYSSYDDAYLDALAARIRQDADAGREVWCIFDNTASGAAARNALDLHIRLDDASNGSRTHLTACRRR
ncbi:DUF72 domain-containing protein [Longimicrobium sp.]|uniref:DUF72 domain-containing protein n=1 Tax=Longimicrobium sp. TaxID=2029185 RepID=UPI002E32C8FA|nr:DUF72 domain-containing protein [Longimicrobium sp.]HEX6040473.1 DUF72 domain-containing protein [Longimicrobium sp.]